MGRQRGGREGGTGALLVLAMVLCARAASADFAWKPLADTVDGRCDHGTGVFQGKLYMFGGYNEADGGVTKYNAIVVYDSGNDAWTELSVAGTPPSPRSASAVAVVGSLLVVIGGINEDEETLNDVYFVNLTAATPTWTAPALTNIAQTPPGVSWCTSTVFGTNVFLYGTYYYDTDQSRTYILDTANWSWELVAYNCGASGTYTPLSNTLVYRDKFRNIDSLASDAAALVVPQIKGSTPLNVTKVRLWLDDAATQNAAAFKASGDAVTAARGMLASVSDSDSPATIVSAFNNFLGYWTNATQGASTTACGRASCPPANCTVPPPMSGARAVYYGGLVYMFGGWSCSGPGIGGPDCFSRDVFVYNTTSRSWSIPVVTSTLTNGDPPPPTSFGSFVLSPAEKVAYAFGGGYLDSAGDWYYDDTVYALNLQTLSWSTPVVKGALPPRRWSHTFDKIDAGFILYGGCKPPESYYHDTMLLYPVETAATKSVAEGTGLTAAVAGRKGHALIQVRDTTGADVLFGGEAVGAFGFSVGQYQSYFRADVVDYANGTYALDYSVTVAGPYRLSITLNGRDIVGSPFNITVAPEVPDPAQTYPYGAGSKGAVATYPARFWIYSADRYGNNAPIEHGKPFVVTFALGGSVVAIHTITDSLDLSEGYPVKFTLPTPGVYNVSILYDGQPVSQSPFALRVSPTATDNRIDGVYIFFLVLGCLLICLSILMMVRMYLAREKKVFKSASPPFLFVILCGSCVSYAWVFFAYPSPTAALCTVQQWCIHVGFALMLGALVLKTQRIAIIFNSKLNKKIRLRDSLLFQYLAVIVAVFIIYMIVWSAAGTPSVEVTSGLSVTETPSGYVLVDDKINKQCRTDWWNYAVMLGELFILLYGMRLAFLVRKTPNAFNESRFISFSVYNWFFVAAVVQLIVHFAVDKDANIVFALTAIQVDLTVGMVVALLFLPKHRAVSLGKGDGSTSQGGDTSSTRMTDIETRASSAADARAMSLLQDECKRLMQENEKLKQIMMKHGNRHVDKGAKSTPPPVQASIRPDQHA